VYLIVGEVVVGCVAAMRLLLVSLCIILSQ